MSQISISFLHAEASSLPLALVVSSVGTVTLNGGIGADASSVDLVGCQATTWTGWEL